MTFTFSLLLKGCSFVRGGANSPFHRYKRRDGIELPQLAIWLKLGCEKDDRTKSDAGGSRFYDLGASRLLRTGRNIA
jgi:hypothetical protein